MSNAKMSLRIVEENIDPSSKRGIRAVLSDGYEEKEKLIYPLESGESEAFFEELKRLRHEFLPRIEGYVEQGGRRLALTAMTAGQILAETRESISEKNAIEIAKAQRVWQPGLFSSENPAVALSSGGNGDEQRKED